EDVVGVEVPGERLEGDVAAVPGDPGRPGDVVAVRAGGARGAAHQGGRVRLQVADVEVAGGVGVGGVEGGGRGAAGDAAAVAGGRGGVGDAACRLGAVGAAGAADERRRVGLQVADEDILVAGAVGRVEVCGEGAEGDEAPVGRDRGRRRVPVARGAG